MRKQAVFKDSKEIKRLGIQNALLKEYEMPGLEKLFEAGHHLNVLDIGCNDGGKTVDRFSNESVSQVIGVEYNHDLAIKASKYHGDNKFFFIHANAEDEEFNVKLREAMKERGIDAFDIIYMSCVLMHLNDPTDLLNRLSYFLRDNGSFVIIEMNDEISHMNPDPDGLVSEFLSMLKEDKYAGVRSGGGTLKSLLEKCGHADFDIWADGVGAGKTERGKKERIFQTYFSFFPEDLLLLLEEEPDNEKYLSWKKWLDTNFSELKQKVMSDKTEIFMGTTIMSCKKGKKA